eukprot:CAMPEP_0185193716 /NCGR_PEP_ID=MMETSP1140-20130426/27371_1 /TAXON_ID=298111 /ORGANISM="Pavlova sp., Strain CCMP459" /LENGTH=145 /DNA_ID=CAMNT_0027760563 /DNA_START=247 /DNA_END=681 /DNA_ORIENTATION=-
MPDAKGMQREEIKIAPVDAAQARMLDKAHCCTSCQLLAMPAASGCDAFAACRPRARADGDPAAVVSRAPSALRSSSRGRCRPPSMYKGHWVSAHAVSSRVLLAAITAHRRSPPPSFAEATPAEGAMKIHMTKPTARRGSWPRGIL